MDRVRVAPSVVAEAPRRAAIYARVSTEDQTKGTSLAAQIERCRDAGAAQGWVIVEEFVDEGVSGALSSRPRLDAMVRLVEDDELDVVAITKLDRVARSLRHLLDILDLFERHSVTLVALDDPLDPSTASGRAMVQLRGVFAELERQLIRERTTEGQRRRVEAGGWPGGPPPYGYRVVDNLHGPGRLLAIEQEEAAVIRLAYKLIALDGLTTGETAEELRRLGTRPRHASAWSYWNLRRLLLDARGISGHWPWRREGRSGREGGDEIVVTVPAILDEREHEQLLASLAETSTQPTEWRWYLLRGRVLSPHGARMQGIPGHGGTRWYRCADRSTQRPSDKDPCDCRRLHAATVEQVVWAHVRELLTSPEALELLATDYETARGALASRERDAIGTLDDRITGLEAEIANEYVALRDDGFDPAVARAAIRKRNETLVMLKRQRQDLLRFRGKNLAAAGLAVRLRALATQARDVLHTADDHLRKRVLDLLDVHVDVLGWDQCDTCQGKGLLARPGPRRRHVRMDDDRRRQPLICPDCLRTRHIPRLHIGGHVPELLLVGLDAQTGRSSAPAAGTGVVVPFEAEIRVA